MTITIPNRPFERRCLLAAVLAAAVLAGACTSTQQSSSPRATATSAAQPAATAIVVGTLAASPTLAVPPPRGTPAPQARVAAPTVTAAPASATPAVPTPAPEGTAAGAQQTVEIQLFGFEPALRSVTVGTTVTWTNHDAIIHSVTGGVSPTPGGSFDSDFFDQNQRFSFSFSQVGEYPYFCKRHPFMQGVISVTP